MSWLAGASRRSCAWVSALTLVCASSPALAQAPPEPTSPAAAPLGPRPKVLLLPTASVQSQVTPMITDRVDDGSRKRLREGNQVTLMPDFVEIRKKLAGQGQSSAVLAQAEQLYASGIGLLTAGENASAHQNFQQAVSLMEQNLVDVRSYGVLTDAIANLALSAFLSGFDLDGRKRMEEFAHLKPEEKLNPDKFPKELLTVYADEVAKVKKAGPGKLIITSNLAGAQVLLDGAERGVTPLTLTDVGFGSHYLVVRAASGEVYGEKIRVRGRGKEQEFKVELAAKSSGALSASRPDELPSYYTDLLAELKTGKFNAQGLSPYLAELAKQSGAQFIAWTLMHRQGSEYVATSFLYRASDGALVRSGSTLLNFELSNLNVGVGELTAALASAVRQLPEDEAVDQVELGQPKAVSVVETPPADTERDPVVLKGEDKKEERLVVIAPPPVVEPASSGSSAWTYVGIGAASALVVGGLIAGGIWLLSGDQPAPGGFNAEVSW